MENFVTFEIAKKLKEKGFKEECLCHYVGEDLYYNIESLITNNQLWFSHNKFDNIWHRDNHDAPTISQVLKWLREKKKLHISTGFSNVTKWRYIIIHLYENYIKEPNIWEKNFDSYEAAVIAGIEYCLDNLI